jgi:hypothetical protein
MILWLATALALSSAAAWPTKGWPSSTPAAEGLDAAVLNRLDAERPAITAQFARDRVLAAVPSR